MIKMTHTGTTGVPNLKPMGELKPLEVGVIVGDTKGVAYAGRVVMRTAAANKFEVMDLTDPRIDGCWTVRNDLMVSILPKGQKLTFTLYNGSK